MISQKIDNPEILEKIKDGTYRGFSIEGYFSEKLETKDSEEELLTKIIEILK